MVINNPNFGGYVVVRVPIGSGNFEYDAYLHVMNRVAPRQNNEIREGAPIGQISDTFAPAGRCFLSFQVLSAQPPEDRAPDFHTFLDPFLRFTNNDDKDPLGSSPGMFDSNNDRRTISLVAPTYFENPINPFGIGMGDVDIIADVRDQMNSGPYIGASAPQYVSYYVRPLFRDTHGVKDATAPYLTYKLDDNWFANLPAAAPDARQGQSDLADQREHAREPQHRGNPCHP